jgi:hypothetical protein
MMLLSAASSAGLAQSAMVELPKPKGPSKFVTEVGGKPAQIGVPSGPKRASLPGVIDIVPAPQAVDVPELPPDPASEQEPQDKDKEAGDSQAPAAQPPGNQAKSPEPDAAACDPDCDDD